MSKGSSYAAAYGDERIPALLFLPKQREAAVSDRGAASRDPMRCSPAFEHGESPATAVRTTSCRSGRALLYPIYKSTYERGDGIEADYPSTDSTFFGIT